MSSNEAPSLAKERRLEAASLEVSTLPVKDFVIEDMVEHFSLVLYGARRKGKSVLLHYIASLLWKRFDEVYLFSLTAGLQGNVWHFVPKENRIQGFDEEKLKEIMDTAMKERKVIEECFEDDQEEAKKKKLDKEMPRRFIIFDDIVSARKVQNSPILDSLFTLGRHHFVSVALLSQNASARASLSISARGNLDLCMNTAMNQLDDTERLSRYYYGIEGWKEGMARINQLTQEPFSFAVSDMAEQFKKGDLANYTYTLTAPPLEEQDSKFKIESKNCAQKEQASLGDEKKAVMTLKVGIERLVNLDSACEGPLDMILPDSDWVNSLGQKSIGILPMGLRPSEARKRKFNKDEDDAKDAKEVVQVDDKDIHAHKKPKTMNWECGTLNWEGNEIIYR